jgi:hypothetical protein
LHIKDGKEFCKILKTPLEGKSYELKQFEEHEIVMNAN